MSPLKIVGATTAILLIGGFSFWIHQKSTPVTSAARSATGPETSSPQLKNDPQQLKLLQLFHSGQYEAALRMADELLGESATPPELVKWILQQLPIILTSHAWNLAQKERCWDAMDVFLRSYKLEKNKATSKGLAFCYFKVKQLSLAVEYFEEYLREVNDDKESLALYIDALESEQQLQRGLDVLEALPHSDAREAAITNLRAKIQKTPQSYVYETQFFRILYQDQLSQPALQLMTDTLEDGLREFVSRFEIDEPKQKIEVLVHDRFDRQGLPDWAGATFDGKIRLPRQQASARLLRHELVHALISEQTKGRQVPTWFNEGLAQWFECNSCSEATFERTQLLKIDELSGSFAGFPRHKAQKAYRQSQFMLTELLKLGPHSEDDAMRRLLRGLSEVGTIDNPRLLQPLDITIDQLMRVIQKKWK